VAAFGIWRAVRKDNGTLPVSRLVLTSTFPARALWGKAGKLGGVRFRDQRSQCKGAFGKTSGRSIFPNAPLRATSSALRSSMLDAIAKALPARINRTQGRVGFALERKLLR